MMKRLLQCLLLFVITKSVCAQHNVIGKIVDAQSRQPLEYVSVMAGTTVNAKTLTDQYGNFNLTVADNAAALIISFAGYKTTSVEINGIGTVKVELQKDVINLQDVVVLSSSNVTKFNTLSKIDLDLKPVKNTQELLRLVPGLFIAQHAGGGKAEQIFLRGFDSDHGTDVQVSMDGIPVNMVSHAHGQGYADAHFIIPETIRDIDFASGPYYTQHGNLNTAGYVAFSSFDNIPKSRVQLEAGRFNTMRGLAMIDLLKKNKDKQSAYIASEFNYTDGPTISKQLFKRFNIFGKYNLAISDKTQLTASVSSFTSKWNASGQVPGRAVETGSIDRFGAVDPTEGGNTERNNANVVLSHTFRNGTAWENQAYYSHYIFDLYSNFTFYLNDPVNGDGINQAEQRNIFGYFSKVSQRYNFGKWSLRSNYGAGLRYDATTDSKLTHVVKRLFLYYVKLGNIKEANAYSFVQQQLSSGKWLIDAGVRLDYFHFNYFDRLSQTQNPSRSKTILSPKVNIQYTINSNVQLFVKTGKGFHSNDTRVVTANGGKEILPAAYGSDIGLILKPNKNFLLNIAAWYLYLDQEFVYVGDEGVIEPSGKTRRAGIDIIARYQFSQKLFANMNLNFTKPRATGEAKGADHIPLAPTMTSTGGLFYRSTAGFNGSITCRNIKNRPANEDNSITAKGYFILDASFNYTKPTFEIGIAIENITNVQWNEAQFATESRLKNEAEPVTELHYTPGTPFFPRLKLALFF